MFTIGEHLSKDGVLSASFHGSFARDVHLRHYPTDRPDAMDEDRTADLGESTGYGWNEAYPSQDYGISFSRAATDRDLDIACGIPGTRVLGYTKRGGGAP